MQTPMMKAVGKYFDDWLARDALMLRTLFSRITPITVFIRQAAYRVGEAVEFTHIVVDSTVVKSVT